MAQSAAPSLDQIPHLPRLFTSFEDTQPRLLRWLSRSSNRRRKLIKELKAYEKKVNKYDELRKPSEAQVQTSLEHRKNLQAVYDDAAESLGKIANARTGLGKVADEALEKKCKQLDRQIDAAWGLVVPGRLFHQEMVEKMVNYLKMMAESPGIEPPRHAVSDVSPVDAFSPNSTMKPNELDAARLAVARASYASVDSFLSQNGSLDGSPTALSPPPPYSKHPPSRVNNQLQFATLEKAVLASGRANAQVVAIPPRTPPPMSSSQQPPGSPAAAISTDPNPRATQKRNTFGLLPDPERPPTPQQRPNSPTRQYTSLKTKSHEHGITR